MKIRNLRYAAILCAVAISIVPVDAQGQNAPGQTLPPLPINGSPTAVMTYPDGSSLIVLSKNGRFPLAVGPAGGAVSIQLRFLPNPIDSSLMVGPLDGGTVPDSQMSTAIGVDGTVTIQFQPDTQPGLYRVLLNQAGTMSLLQFWVADPDCPLCGPPALVPIMPPPAP